MECKITKNYFSKIILFLVVCCISEISGRGIDLGFCGNTNFICQCGGQESYNIYIPIKECTYFYKFEAYCKPCEDVKSEEVCAKYRHCQDCVVGLSRCARCPPNKYGDWCTGECTCQNGGSCNHHDGTCACPPRYTGQHCEKHIACPMPIITFPLTMKPFPDDSPILIDYSCAEGYALVGLSRTICSLNQQWDRAPPKCVPRIDKELVNVPIKCPPLHDEIDNGRVNVTAAPHMYRYTCNSGFVLKGQEVITCEKGSSWSAPVPFCYETNPTTATNELLVVDCETKATDILRKELGSNISVTCPPECEHYNETVVYGTKVYAETSSLCRAAIHFGIISSWEGGEVTVFYLGPKNYFQSTFQNRILSLKLVEDTNKTSAFAFSLLHNVENSTAQEEIFIDGCEDPGPLLNGRLEYNNDTVSNRFPIGSTITYSCDVTHYLRGSSAISCTEKLTWDWPKPRCLAIMCRDLANIQNTVLQYIKIEGENQEKDSRRGYPIGMVSLKRKLSLDQNDTVSEKEKTDGEFVADLLKNLTILNGFQPIGTRALYRCESKFYRLTGFKSRACQSNGQWSGRNTKRYCTPICGQSESGKKSLIANGNATTTGQWPWQAAISTTKNKIFFCGGSVISERFVLTAAHCITFEWTTRLFPLDSYLIQAGKYFFDHLKDDHEVQERMVHEVYLHPDFDPQSFDSDIALLELEENFKFSPRVQPICLPTARTTKRNIMDGSRGVVTGWGDQGSNIRTEVLQEAVIPVFTKETCERDYNTSGQIVTLTKRMFCGGNKEATVTACTGDSGGPFVFLEESGRRWVLEGIVSWSLPGKCGESNHYTGFTLVQKFNKWISQYVY